MAGTKAGAIKTRQTILERHGPDYYKRVGSIGGRTAHKVDENGKALKGFAVNREPAQTAGKKGGEISRKTGRVQEISQLPRTHKPTFKLFSFWR